MATRRKRKDETPLQRAWSARGGGAEGTGDPGPGGNGSEGPGPEDPSEGFTEGGGAADNPGARGGPGPTGGAGGETPQGTAVPTPQDKAGLVRGLEVPDVLPTGRTYSAQDTRDFVESAAEKHGYDDIGLADLIGAALAPGGLIGLATKGMKNREAVTKAAADLGISDDVAGAIMGFDSSPDTGQNRGDGPMRPPSLLEPVVPNEDTVPGDATDPVKEVTSPFVPQDDGVPRPRPTAPTWGAQGMARSERRTPGWQPYTPTWMQALQGQADQFRTRRYV